jgi:hypothetical protein
MVSCPLKSDFLPTSPLKCTEVISLIVSFRHSIPRQRPRQGQAALAFPAKPPWLGFPAPRANAPYPPGRRLIDQEEHLVAAEPEAAPAVRTSGCCGAGRAP